MRWTSIYLPRQLHRLNGEMSTPCSQAPPGQVTNINIIYSAIGHPSRALAGSHLYLPMLFHSRCPDRILRSNGTIRVTEPSGHDPIHRILPRRLLPPSLTVHIPPRPTILQSPRRRIRLDFDHTSSLICICQASDSCLWARLQPFRRWSRWRRDPHRSFNMHHNHNTHSSVDRVSGTLCASTMARCANYRLLNYRS